MPSRFVFASVSLPAGGPKDSGHQPGLNFGWQPAGSPTPLLAFINAPISLSFVDGLHTAPQDAAEEPKRQLPPDPLQAASRPTDTTKPSIEPSRPRFPPWKQLGLTAGPSGPTNRHVLAEQGQMDEAGSIAVESSAGGRRRRVYLARGGTGTATATAPGQPGASTGSGSWEGFDIVDERQTHEDHLRSLIHAYLLPNGFPESVGPQYAPYMAWRGVQYFFGGAISVFTTQSLLGALGVAGRFQGEAAAAINWVIKDGAGRLGRLLFARWGRELDCELKQFRLAGDLLMEAGAALELATIYAPPAFLPLACTANLSKNLAAVAASSTRAPIYRTFALQNNLADITAKGESVANLADILGTVAGIALSRMKLPRMPTFCVLSAGYLVSSRKEVDSVELPYMNRARLAYSARRYLTDGCVPGVAEANHNEPLLPWGGRYNQGRLVLGASVEAACAGPSDLATAAGRFPEQHYRYMLTYRPDTQKAYVLLREGATSQDCLQASFFGHVFLHLLDGGSLEAVEQRRTEGGGRDAAAVAAGAGAGAGAGGEAPGCRHSDRGGASACGGSGSGSFGGGSGGGSGRSSAGMEGGGAGPGLGQQHGRKEAGGSPPPEGWRAALDRAQVAVSELYPDFVAQAERNGWKLQQTMLNPKENRLMRLTAPLQA